MMSDSAALGKRGDLSTLRGPSMRNVDPGTVEGFGEEWSRFDQSSLGEEERRDVFESYFRSFPWSTLPKNAVGFDAGCGSGRWAALVAPRVGRLYCVDASARALAVARKNLAHMPNVELVEASVQDMPLANASMDFGYSLGVLHHVPDTEAALAACVAKLKPGAPFLLYLYYAFDNRPLWFRSLWRASDVVRKRISALPARARTTASEILAASVYWPLARSARALERLGMDVRHFPLAAYRHRTFYVMRTDALDRFGTSLERRFTKQQVVDLMRRVGLENIRVSDEIFWCAVGQRARTSS